MEFPQIKDFEHFQQVVKQNASILFYFSNDDCNVCKVLKPKVFELLQQYFPEIGFFYVDTKFLPDVAAQNRVFTIPTLLVFFDGNELIRKSRYIGIEEIRQELARPYEIMFA
ncbi:MAG: thioredoxin family protein [Bacteroidales bacterium]|nr:thioredoxin family protein [Bacteroidales bacterium]